MASDNLTPNPFPSGKGDRIWESNLLPSGKEDQIAEDAELAEYEAV
jgi:hypothetical protein